MYIQCTRSWSLAACVLTAAPDAWCRPRTRAWYAAAVGDPVYDLRGWSRDRRAALAAALREAVARGGFSLEAIGSSMEPTVPGGSRLELAPLPVAPEVGALLVFLPADGPHPICHRVVRVQDGVMEVAGDRAGQVDHRVSADLAIGVVASFVFGGRRFGPLGPPPSRYRRIRARAGRRLRRLVQAARGGG